MLTPEQFKDHIVVFHERRATDTTPAITIVIVTYSSGDAAIDLLDSLKKQTLAEFETILINYGGLPDPVVARIQQYPLLYIENNTNSPCLARNIGIAHAAADIVLFLDDDCIADSHLVSRGDFLAQTIRKNQYAGRFRRFFTRGAGSGFSPFRLKVIVPKAPVDNFLNKSG